MKESVYIAWTDFQRRQVSLKRIFGFRCVFMPTGSGGAIRKLYFYARNFFQTLIFLFRERPHFVWVQLPQTPLILAALLFQSSLGRRRVSIIADCHNAYFREPWKGVVGWKWSLNSSDFVVVHNRLVADKALELGIEMARMIVLPDLPASRLTPRSQDNDGLRSRPFALVIASFSADEPIANLIAAAAAFPEIDFLITGDSGRRAKVAYEALLPVNVSLTGYVDLDVYEDYLERSLFVVCLSELRDVQMSGCAEAVGFGKPLVVSLSDITRESFPFGAVLANGNCPDSLRAAFQQMVANFPEYTLGAQKLRPIRERAILDAINGSPLSKMVVENCS